MNFRGFVFLEFGATGEGVGFGVIGGFLVFCLSQFEGE